MKRNFWDSNCDPEPSMPWTKRIGFCPKDCAPAACEAVVRRNATQASAVVRTRDKYTASVMYQIDGSRASVLIEPLEQAREAFEHRRRRVQLGRGEAGERLAPERLERGPALLAYRPSRLGEARLH